MREIEVDGIFARSDDDLRRPPTWTEPFWDPIANEWVTTVGYEPLRSFIHHVIADLSDEYHNRSA